MVRFCPSCGTELKSEFKFCPSCGYNLQNIGNREVSTESRIVIECENCGTDNPETVEFCEGCGLKLKGEKKTIEAAKPSVIKESQKQVSEHKPKRKERSPQPAGGTKEIDSKKIYGILAGVLIIALIILLASGVFDKPVTSISNTSQQPGQNPGVDLSALERINELEERLKINPDDNQSLLELAHLRNDSRMYEKAIENYKLYLTRVPADADARIDMGVCYYNLGRYDEAIAAMTKALEYKPDHQIGHLNLGIVNLSAGNVEKSKEWLQKAVELGPATDAGRRAQELLTSH